MWVDHIVPKIIHLIRVEISRADFDQIKPERII